MPAWESERIKVWRLLFDLKDKVKELERELHEQKEISDKPSRAKQKSLILEEN